MHQQMSQPISTVKDQYRGSLITAIIEETTGKNDGIITLSGWQLRIRRARLWKGKKCLVRLADNANMLGSFVSLSEEDVFVPKGEYSLYAHVRSREPPVNLKEVEEYFNPGSVGQAVYANDESRWIAFDKGCRVTRKNLAEEVHAILTHGKFPPYFLSPKRELIRDFKELSVQLGLQPIAVHRFDPKFVEYNR